ncbi:hypothetical protein X997_5277 [Burkholderia pseudomallei A79C]|nr:hypothetical protein X997_5277 [Burkholderia pseudomallei A79C]
MGAGLRAVMGRKRARRHARFGQAAAYLAIVAQGPEPGYHLHTAIRRRYGQLAPDGLQRIAQVIASSVIEARRLADVSGVMSVVDELGQRIL